MIHPQCFLSNGQFAGSDEERLKALRDVMADDSVDAIWFARGGYGSNRIAEAAVHDLPAAARSKTYLGYSDAGFLLAAFDKSGLNVAHGPMVQDIAREGGTAAIHRALDWLVRKDEEALEPGLSQGRRAMAFNLTVLSHLIGTAIEPDFTGAELLIEDVAEHEYRIDRTMFHVTGSEAIRGVGSSLLPWVTFQSAAAKGATVSAARTNRGRRRARRLQASDALREPGGFGRMGNLLGGGCRANEGTAPSPT
jgi:muramoyltetrapeptide carboxypeptidase